MSKRTVTYHGQVVMSVTEMSSRPTISEINLYIVVGVGEYDGADIDWHETGVGCA